MKKTSKILTITVSHYEPKMYDVRIKDWFRPYFMFDTVNVFEVIPKRILMDWSECKY